jgi:hypothetical protein
VLAKPIGGACFVELAGGDREHGRFGVVDGGVGAPGPFVVRDEQAQRDPSGALVAVGEWVVAGEPDDEDGGLVLELGVEVGVAEAGRRGVQAESARSRLAILITVVASRPVTAAPIAM